MRIVVAVTGKDQIESFLKNLGEKLEIEVPQTSAEQLGEQLPRLIRRKMESSDFGVSQDGTPALVEDGGYSRSWKAEVTGEAGSFTLVVSPQGTDENGIEYAKLGEMLELGTRQHAAIPHVDVLNAAAAKKGMDVVKRQTRRVLREMK